MVEGVVVPATALLCFLPCHLLAAVLLPIVEISPHLEEECPDRGQGCNEINSLLEHRLRLLTKAPPATGLLVPWVGLYRLITKSAMQGGLRFGRRRQRGLLLEAKALINPES